MHRARDVKLGSLTLGSADKSRAAGLLQLVCSNDFGFGFGVASTDDIRASLHVLDSSNGEIHFT